MKIPFEKAVQSMINMIESAPRFGSPVFRSALDPFLYDEANGRTDEEWKEVQVEVANRLRREVVEGSLTEEVLPRVECIFTALADRTERDRPMHAWSWAYFHGELQDHFDSTGLIPGDLVKCSIPQYEYPLGMYRCTVDDMPAISYTWEEVNQQLRSDFHGNRWFIHVRRGLIVKIGDKAEYHEYALRCMEKRVSNL